MRAVLALLVVVAGTLPVQAGCTCTARPNPRVSSIVREPANDDDPRRTLRFRYDGDGRVDEVVRSEGDATRTWALAWDGGRLVKATVTSGDDVVVETEHVIEYDQGRVLRVRATSTSDDEMQVSTFSYDEKGRFVKSVLDGATEDVTATIEYDRDGLITSMKSERSNDGDVTSTSTIEVQREDGVMAAMRLHADNDDPVSIATEFDDDTRQLTHLAFASDDDITSHMDYFYDGDGRIKAMEQTAALGDLTVAVATTDIEYEDGDAASLDLWANEVFLMGLFFDFRGGHWGTFDNTTTVPRLAFPSW